MALPFLPTILLLHVLETYEFLRAQIVKVSTGTDVDSKALLLCRFILDGVICAIETTKQRDRICGTMQIEIRTVKDIERLKPDRSYVIDWFYELGEEIHISETGIFMTIQNMRKSLKFLSLNQKMEYIIQKVANHFDLTVEKYIASPTEQLIPEDPSNVKKRKAQEAAMEQMKTKQQAFERTQLVDLSKEDSTLGKNEMEISDSNMLSSLNQLHSQMVCAICHGPPHESEGFGLNVFVQVSNVLSLLNCKSKTHKSEHEIGELQCVPEETSHIITCGHGVHEGCLLQLLHSGAHHNGLIFGLGVESFLHPHEFLCPLCRRPTSGIINLPEGVPCTDPSVKSKHIGSKNEFLQVGVKSLDTHEAQSNRSLALIHLVHGLSKGFPSLFQNYPGEQSCISKLNNCICIFGSQIVILEIQAHRDVKLLNPNKILLLRAFLHHIVISLRNPRHTAEWQAKCDEIQKDLISVLNGQKTAKDIDLFALYILTIVWLILTRASTDEAHKHGVTLLAQLLKNRIGRVESKPVLLRQITLFHMILCPTSFPFSENLQQTIIRAIETPPPYLKKLIIGKLREKISPRMPVGIPLLLKLTENVLDFSLESVLDRKQGCYDLFICLHCGPKKQFTRGDLLRHACECGGGICLFVNVIATLSNVVLVDGRREIFASLRPLWLNKYGEPYVIGTTTTELRQDPTVVDWLHRYWLEGSFVHDSGCVIVKSTKHLHGL